MSEAPALTREARVKRLYSNQGVQPLAMTITTGYEWAIEYLEQCPALAVFVAYGGLPSRRSELAMIGNRFSLAAAKKPRLRDLAAEFHCPLPLRKLHGIVIIPSNFETVFALRHVGHSTLSQAIPEERQIEWVRALRFWRAETVRTAPVKDWSEHWPWYVAASGRAACDGVRAIDGHARTIIDYFGRGGGALYEKWTFQNAIRAAERWHERIADQRTAEQTMAEMGVEFDAAADYEDLPDQTAIGDIEFRALKTGRDLFLDGAAMRHCVASYARHVIFGGTRIYSLRRGDLRMATLELRPEGTRYVLAQLQGPCNSAPDRLTRSAAIFFVELINQRRKSRPSSPPEGQ